MQSTEVLAERARAIMELDYDCTCKVGGQDSTSVDLDWLRDQASNLLEAVEELEFYRTNYQIPRKVNGVFVA